MMIMIQNIIKKIKKRWLIKVPQISSYLLFGDPMRSRGSHHTTCTSTASSASVVCEKGFATKVEQWV